MAKSTIVVHGALVGPAIATLLKRIGFDVSVLERNDDQRLDAPRASCSYAYS